MATWILYQKQIRLLDWFHQRCLCSILCIKRQDYVSNEEVLKKVSLPRTECICFRSSWAGLATSLGWKTYASAKQSSSANSQKGKHDNGAPKTRYKNQLKRQLAKAGINHQSWQQEDSDGDSWCSSVRKASRKFKAERHEVAEKSRRRLKEQAAYQSSSAQTFVCPKCSRECASRIGLYSHSMQELPINLSKVLVCEEAAIIIII